MIAHTPYLSINTLCYVNSSITMLNDIAIGSKINLIHRDRDNYAKCIGTVVGRNKQFLSNTYTYACNETNDQQIAGMDFSLVCNGAIIRCKNNIAYYTNTVVADTIDKVRIGHPNLIVVKTVGVLNPELLISIIIQYEFSETITQTLLPTANGFLILLKHPK